MHVLGLREKDIKEFQELKVVIAQSPICLFFPYPSPPETAGKVDELGAISDFIMYNPLYF